MSRPAHGSVSLTRPHFRPTLAQRLRDCPKTKKSPRSPGGDPRCENSPRVAKASKPRQPLGCRPVDRTDVRAEYSGTQRVPQAFSSRLFRPPSPEHPYRAGSPWPGVPETAARALTTYPREDRPIAQASQSGRRESVGERARGTVCPSRRGTTQRSPSSTPQSPESDPGRASYEPRAQSVRAEGGPRRGVPHLPHRAPNAIPAERVTRPERSRRRPLGGAMPEPLFGQRFRSS